MTRPPAAGVRSAARAPSAAPADRGPRPTLGWAGLAVLLVAVAVTQGCRTGRSAPPLSDAAGVQALLRTVAAEGPLSARGRAIVRLRTGEREAPALGVAFSLREARELGLVLRPGVLPPVLSLWAGADGWLLTLPREKTAFEVAHAPGWIGSLPPDPPAASATRTGPAHSGPTLSGPTLSGPSLSGPMLSGIAAWVLGPHTLLAALNEPDVRPEGTDWVITGRAPGLGGAELRVEVRLEAAGGAISRWNMRSGDATEMVTVSYDPPRAKAGCGRSGERIHFALPAAALAGTLTLDHVRCTAPGPRERPAVPGGWVSRPGDDLLPALARLQADLEAES